MANAEAISSRHREYYLENSEHLKKKAREHYHSNKEEIAVKKREYNAANKESIKASQRAYNAANPEKVSAYKRNYKALKKNASGKHNSSDVKRIFAAQRGKCATCKTKLFKSGEKKFHVDHVVPLAKGGGNGPDNLQCLCPSCNLRKSDKDPIAWANENGLLI